SAQPRSSCESPATRPRPAGGSPPASPRGGPRPSVARGWAVVCAWRVDRALDLGTSVTYATTGTTTVAAAADVTDALVASPNPGRALSSAYSVPSQSSLESYLRAQHAKYGGNSTWQPEP